MSCGFDENSIYSTMNTAMVAAGYSNIVFISLIIYFLENKIEKNGKFALLEHTHTFSMNCVDNSFILFTYTPSDVTHLKFRRARNTVHICASVLTYC